MCKSAGIARAWFAVIVCAALLVASAASAQRQPGLGETLRDNGTAPALKGAVVLSLGIIKPLQCTNVRLSWHALDPRTWYSEDELKKRAARTSRPPPPPVIGFAIPASTSDFDQEDAQSTVIAEELPVGMYEITNIECVYYLNPYNTGTRIKDGISIPFEVVDGEVTYLGQFMVAPIIVINFLNRPFTRGVYLVLSDESDRDLALARQRKPLLFDRPVRKQVYVPADTPNIYTKALPQPKPAPSSD